MTSCHIIYDPRQERLCREEHAHLSNKLEDAGLAVHEIPVQTFIFDRYTQIGLLDKIFEKERTSPGDVYRDLAKNYRPALARHIVAQAEELEGQDAVLLLTQTAHLCPFARVSNLLEHRENHVRLPFVVLYPGEELVGSTWPRSS